MLLCLYTHTGLASETETPQRYWYDGAAKTPLYRQPQLDGSAHGAASKPGAAQEHLSPQARTKSGAAPDRSARTVYLTAADPNSARLMIQAPGILFSVIDEAGAERAQAWLGARGLRAEPIAGGAVFKVHSVAGEQALDLANALYESGLVKYSQPNWLMDIDRRTAPGMPNAVRSGNVERAVADALAPPRRRCAELRAGIDQAITDANGSRGGGAHSQSGWDRRSGTSMREPPLSAGMDRRTRLENECAQLDCERRTP